MKSASSSKKSMSNKESKKSAKPSQTTKKSSNKSESKGPKLIVYEPFEVTIATAETAVKLLVTQEAEVLEKVLASLNAFIGRDKEHLVVLRDLDIVDMLILSMDHRNECIRRYCLKLLAEMCEFPDVITKIRAHPTAIETLCAMLINEENDKVIFEFSSEILSNVGGHFGTVRMLGTNIADCLIPRLRSPDPDVQKNCLEVMIHILRDPVGGDTLVNSPTFALCPIIKLFTSEYEAVQRLSLRAMEYISQRTKNANLMAQFVKEKAMDALLGILEQIEWADLHHLALASIKNYCDCESNLDQFVQSSAITRLVRFTEVIEQPDIIECALQVLVRIAQLPGGVKICIDAGVTPLLINYLKRDNPNAAETACIGLVHLMTDPKVFNLAVESVIANDLLRIVADSTRTWEIRNYAGNALFNMMKRGKSAVDQVYEGNGVQVFCGLFDTNARPPMEMLFTAINCITEMSRYEDVRLKILDLSLIKSLLTLMKSKAKNYFQLVISTLQCLSTFLNEKLACDYFIASRGVEIVMDVMKELSIPLKLEAVALIQQAANDDTLASAFINGGALEMLLEERLLRKKYPLWEATIEALFKSNLSAKFAKTGRLDFKDITKDNFYLSEKVEKPFMILESLLGNRATPIRPIYVANFKQPQQPPPSKPRRRRSIRPPRKPAKATEPVKKVMSKKITPRSSSGKTSKTKLKGATSATKSLGSRTSLTKEKKPRSATGSMRSLESVDGRKSRRSKRMLKRLASKLAKTGQTSFIDIQIGPNTEQFDAVVTAKYGVAPPDYNLYSYLKELKEQLLEPVYKYWYEMKVIDVPDLMARAQILAIFVDKCMKGPDVNDADSEECLRHKHELHLQELRRQSGTNVIPIGHVRIGLHLERAMLYKVLADRIGLPCALQRGDYGRTWVEIAMPEPVTSVDKDKEDWELPASMLRPYFVVDLMKDISHLMPLGGAQAHAYCNLPGIYDYPLEYHRPVL